MQHINFYRNKVAINVLAKDIANAREIYDAAEGHAVIGILSAQFSSVEEGVLEVKRWMTDVPSISVGLGAGDPAQYYKAIAAVFQDPFALSFSIAENVSCSPLEETDRNRCREALIRAGLWEKIASLPQKEETYLGKDMADDGITLSGGEMQKLMMARALYKNCHLLLLDEPAAGMNPKETEDLAELIFRMRHDYQLSVLLIEHDMPFVNRLCERVMVLEYGKPLFSGLMVTVFFTAFLGSIICLGLWIYSRFRPLQVKTFD